MRLTSEQLQEIESRPGYRKVGDTRGGPLPLLQKLQDDPVEPAKDNDQAGKPSLDGEGYPEFRLSVTLCISDERDRDNDGAYSTIQDCLIAAVGRLAQMDSRTLRKHAAGFKRKRRGRRRNLAPPHKSGLTG